MGTSAFTETAQRANAASKRGHVFNHAGGSHDVFQHPQNAYARRCRKSATGYKSGGTTTAKWARVVPAPPSCLPLVLCQVRFCTTAVSAAVRQSDEFPKTESKTQGIVFLRLMDLYRGMCRSNTRKASLSQLLQCCNRTHAPESGADVYKLSKLQISTGNAVAVLWMWYVFWIPAVLDVVVRG